MQVKRGRKLFSQGVWAPAERIAAVKQELADVEQELEEAFARWEALESMSG